MPRQILDCCGTVSTVRRSGHVFGSSQLQRRTSLEEQLQRKPPRHSPLFSPRQELGIKYGLVSLTPRCEPRPPRLQHPHLPLSLLACLSRTRRGQLPLPLERHLAIHSPLDVDSIWSIPYHSGVVCCGDAGKKDEVEGFMGGAGCVRDCGWGGGDHGGEYSGSDVSSLALRRSLFRRVVWRSGAEYTYSTNSSLGAVYNAGFFHMSTWIPFVWSIICVLVLILSSFSIQGGL
jgi:hypothetical protein